MAEIIDGKGIARAIRAEVKEGIAALAGPVPVLAVVAAGDDEASAAYLRSQSRTAERLGIEYRLETLAASATTVDLALRVESLAARTEVAGIMLQVPLPAGVDAARVREAIPVAKDVEAVTERAAGRLVQKTHTVAPCTAAAAMRCVEVYGSVPVALADQSG